LDHKATMTNIGDTDDSLPVEIDSGRRGIFAVDACYTLQLSGFRATVGFTRNTGKSRDNLCMVRRLDGGDLLLRVLCESHFAT